MSQPLPDASLDQPFRTARTTNGYPGQTAAPATLGNSDPAKIFPRNPQPGFKIFSRLA